MKTSAVLFDIYKTLLTVRVVNRPRSKEWTRLCREMLPGVSVMPHGEFHRRCEEVVRRQHEVSRTIGIIYPEVFWPDVVRKAWPALAGVSPELLRRFQRTEIAMRHTTILAKGAAGVLRQLVGKGVPVGLVSNCQPYSLDALDAALVQAGLHRTLFDASLCFFSFEHGFSKPDPHVFMILWARLAALGISPADTLVVGDRFDNDISPARAMGFGTWLLTSRPGSGSNSGGWMRLSRYLRVSLKGGEQRPTRRRTTNGVRRMDGTTCT